MKGVILGLETESGEVIILGHDDKRYRLLKSEWKSARDPKVGMDINFLTSGDDLAKDAYYIPKVIDQTSNKQRTIQAVANLTTLIPRTLKNFRTQLPPILRGGRTLVLLAVLLSIVAALLISIVADEIVKAKWEREAPQREEARKQSVINYSEDCGRNAGIKMCKAGLATGIMRARTEAEIRQVGYFLWANSNNKDLLDVCNGFIRPTGGDYETTEVQESFVNGFIQGYIGEINNYKQRNQPLY
jgi:hypothetical protein